MKKKNHVEVIKVTTGDLHFPVSYDVLNKGQVHISVREQFLPIIMSTICLVHDTIGSLKDKIHQEKRVDPSYLKLFFAGVELDDRRTFYDYSIPCRATIDLMFQCSGDITVYVAANTCLILDSDTTVHTVKALFHYHTGISTDHLRLAYDGLELQDSHTLEFHNVQYESVLHFLDEELTTPLMIYVWTASTEKRFHLVVDYLCTINDVKAIIQEHEGIPAHLQTLYLPQKRLLDGSSTILDNCIHHNSTIHLVQVRCLS